MRSPDAVTIPQLATAMVAAMLLLLVALLVVPANNALARFTRTASVPANTFTTDTLDPPTGLTASGGASITLNWTASADAYASGHRVFRGTSTGGPYTQIAQVTPRTTTSYVDSPTPGTYYYVVRAYYQSWESANGNEANATASGSLSQSRFAGAGVSEGKWALVWSSPANITADDNTDSAITNFDSDETVQRLRSSSYGFAIPANATIVGIEVQVEIRDDSAGGGVSVTDQEAQLTKAGVPVGNDKSIAAPWPSTRTPRSYGGPADLWGTTWTPAEINAAGFGFGLRSGTSGNGDNSKVDYHRIIVTYTVP